MLSFMQVRPSVIVVAIYYFDFEICALVICSRVREKSTPKVLFLCIYHLQKYEVATLVIEPRIT